MMKRVHSRALFPALGLFQLTEGEVQCRDGVMNPRRECRRRPARAGGRSVGWEVLRPCLASKNVIENRNASRQFVETYHYSCFVNENNA